MALKSQGTTVGVESATPDTYDIIGQVSGIDGIGSGTASENDVTHLASTAREFIMGLPDEGTATVTGFLDPDDTTGQVAMRTARDNQSKEKFQVTLVDATTITFEAFVMQFSFSVQPDGTIPFTSQLRITAKAIWA